MDSLQKKNIKVLQLTDWASFIEDVNYNFSVLLSSPLYQGVIGEKGNAGDSGEHGTRGSMWMFATYQKIIDTFGDISTPSQINADYLSTKISDSVTRKQLFEALTNDENDTFVDGDVIVANGYVYRVNLAKSIVEYTQETLSGSDSSEQSITNIISTQIQEQLNKLNFDEIVQTYIAKDVTYKNNADSSGTNTMGEISSVTAIDIDDPSFGKGLIDESTKHKFLTSPDTIIDIETFVTHLIGSYKLYHQLIQQTIDYNNTHIIKNSNANFGPNASKRPSMILLQNDYNSGVMIGHRLAQTFAEFGCCYINDKNEFVISAPSKSSLHGARLILSEDSVNIEAKHLYLNDIEIKPDNSVVVVPETVAAKTTIDATTLNENESTNVDKLKDEVSELRKQNAELNKTLETLSKRIAVLEANN